MSKRDYEATADILRETIIIESLRRKVAGRFAVYFASHSDRFDKAMFYERCRV